MNEVQRSARIDQFFDGIAQREDFKTARKTERLCFTHGYKIGDILYSSWGYDQTNIDWYQVTATTAKTITVCKIESYGTETGFMCGETTPRPYVFIPGKTFTRKVTPSYGTGSTENKRRISLSSFESARQWDGTPKHNSWYA